MQGDSKLGLSGKKSEVGACGIKFNRQGRKENHKSLEGYSQLLASLSSKFPKPAGDSKKLRVTLAGWQFLAFTLRMRNRCIEISTSPPRATTFDFSDLGLPSGQFAADSASTFSFWSASTALFRSLLFGYERLASAAMRIASSECLPKAAFKIVSSRLAMSKVG